MKTIRNLAAVLLLVILALAAVVVTRTVTFKAPAPSAAIAVPAPPAIDAALAAQHLAAAVRFRTVSHEDPAQNDPAAWVAQRDWLAATYPHFAAKAVREIVGPGALLWTWRGSDPALKPIILMAHQDVVPVSDDTRNLWRADPFAGEIRDGAVWGRGSVDDKGSLIAILEAADALAAGGFVPRRTIMVESGQDEEVGGTGARAVAALLKARGVSALYAIDEGSVVLKEMPVTHRPAVLIGVSEKGYATLVVTAHGAGGHSSAPPKDTAVTTLARAVTAIADRPFPLALSGPSGAMLRALAPHMGFVPRMAIANDWLFGPLLLQQIGATPVGRSMLHTTIAPTMLSGSPKANVLPDRAVAEINYRIAPGQTAADVMARARAAVGSLPVDLAWAGEPKEPSAVSSTTSEGWSAVSAAAGAEFPGAPIAPSLVTAGTDGHSMYAVTPDVYRFQPILFGLGDIEMIHGVNEHLKITDLKRMTDFYARLMLMGNRGG